MVKKDEERKHGRPGCPEGEDRMSLVRKKIRKVCRMLRKNRDGNVSYTKIGAETGIERKTLYNWMSTPRSSISAWLLFRLCKVYGLDIRYFMDDTIPVNAPFSEAEKVSLYELRRQYTVKSEPRFFHMAAGRVLGELSRTFDCAMFFPEELRAILKPDIPAKPDIRVILEVDGKKCFRLGVGYPYKFPDTEDMQILSFKNLEKLHETLKNYYYDDSTNTKQNRKSAGFEEPGGAASGGDDDVPAPVCRNRMPDVG